jgi:hypothetical protein
MAALAIVVRVALAATRCRGSTAAAAHTLIAALDRPRLLAGRVG